jgi:metal-sulfur cluster biosynthetic enzyme
MDFYDDESKIEIKVYDALKSVIDPEVGINIIDMGLVYDIKYNSSTGIYILMTLSSKGCPMGDMIMEDISNTLNTEFPGIGNKIELTWTPAWTSDFIKATGRKELGLD